MRLFTQAELRFFQNKFLNVTYDGFKTTIQSTMDWYSKPGTAQYFQKQQGRLTTFFKESGIDKEWSNIVEERAVMGADITEQIYDYSRRVLMADNVIPYTTTEKRTLNRFCDYNYELIKDVTQDQIKGIRESLIQDFAEGRNSSRTEILRKLEDIQLQPIHTFSPEQRAVMIARTETSRITNVALLEQYRRDGVREVSPFCNTDCEECNSHTDERFSIDEAIEQPIYHPNCSCIWMPAADSQTGLIF